MPASVSAGHAPVDPAALADVLRPFGDSRTLPAPAYTNPEVFAWERRHFFAGAWTCLGRSDLVRAGGEGGAGAAVSHRW